MMYPSMLIAEVTEAWYWVEASKSDWEYRLDLFKLAGHNLVTVVVLVDDV